MVKKEVCTTLAKQTNKQTYKQIYKQINKQKAKQYNSGQQFQLISIKGYSFVCLQYIWGCD